MTTNDEQHKRAISRKVDDLKQTYEDILKLKIE
jgi:hypothetical protein